MDTAQAWHGKDPQTTVAFMKPKLASAREALDVVDLIDSGRARELREQSGLSQAEVAAACEVTQVAVLRWERGERRPRGRNVRAYHHLLMELEARQSRRMTS